MFSTHVLEFVKRIPVGRVSTYSDIACALGNPNKMRHNPDFDNVHFKFKNYEAEGV